MYRWHWFRKLLEHGCPGPGMPVGPAHETGDRRALQAGILALDRMIGRRA